MNTVNYKLVAKNIQCWVFALAMFAFGSTVSATEWTRLVPEGFVFPYGPVATSGNRVVVGGSYAADRSRVTVYENNGNQWNETVLVTPDSAGADGSEFGVSVASSGDLVVIGGYSWGVDDIPRGGGYVFQKNTSGTWVETQLINGNAGNVFLHPKVAIVGNSAVVATPLHRGGVVRVFNQAQFGVWNEAVALTSEQGSNLFGQHIATHGNTLVVSSVSTDGFVLLHVYQLNGSWSRQTTLRTSHTDSLSMDLAVGDGIIALSDPFNRAGRGSASVTVYQRQSNGNWSESRLSTNEGSDFDLFGTTLAIEDGDVIVGAPNDNQIAQLGGAIYKYSIDGSGRWLESKWMTGSENTGFGHSVALDESRVVVGGQGAIYISDDNAPVTLSSRRLNRTQLAFELRSLVADVTEWQLQLGSTPGGSEYYSSGVLPGATQSQTVSNLPNDGKSLVYITLSYRVGNSDWRGASSTFVSARQSVAFDSFPIPPDFQQEERDSASGVISSIAANSNMIAVGTPLDTNLSSYSGSVTTYRFNNGSSFNTNQFSKSKPVTGPLFAIDTFAASLALSDSTLVVGQSGSSGRVGVYPANNINNQSVNWLSASDANPALFESLGATVALDDSDLIIAGSEVGAYLFESNGNGSFTETKLSIDAEHGMSVAGNGNRVVVGEKSGTPADFPVVQGSASVYDRTISGQWQRTRLWPDGNHSNSFGSAVAIHGDTIVVADPGYTIEDIPSIYIYEYTSGRWALTQRLTASDVSVGDAFGSALAINNSRMIVGAHSDDDNGTSSGAVYVYEKNTAGVWIETKWTANDSSRYFGQSVAMHNDTVVVASYTSVYVLEVSSGADNSLSDNPQTAIETSAPANDSNTSGNMAGSGSEALTNEDIVAEALAAFPVCGSSVSDPDGDGWGWENNATCRLATSSDAGPMSQDASPVAIAPSAIAICQSADSDPDGDGWGWENGQSCSVPVDSVPAVVTNDPGIPECLSADSDTDNDGWGWENGASCIVTPTTSSSAAGVLDSYPVCQLPDSDIDGDGWGWENGGSCRAN